MTSQPFELETFMPYLLNQAAEVSSLSFQKVYKERYGMLRTEWRVLFHLGLYGQMTASEIGTRARMHKTKISRAVHKLSQRSFVTGVTDDNDRRVTHLTLTSQGQAAYDYLYKVAQDYEEKLMARLDVQEAEVLRRALIKLTRI
ncbi:MarR family winged helix-turn-helix transcriptional regulator [Sulfitobacter noctilucicola]|uniref:DNA-binding MarR family transcriptional regulator n=1 Tax=Sulfitobacter noctilucicola TaxID=1342301 RepID=A0A7W6M674_9RHOB|nr:MarR family transcriptional regulator [Sulfitobacter noctilucicola]MBB4173101.1 DNA-binding MarR family transcriptional regulator [Sulfitobacter noctilucicola]